jgi:large subunit ribosomal protein L32
VPVPKRRTTPGKRNARRANHDKVAAPNLVPCTNCSAPTLPHRVCAACGFYGKRAVLQKKEAENSTEAGDSSS